MFGAIVGDIVGSVYEFNNIKTKDFRLFDPHCHFTDDTVMTFAIAEALRKTEKKNYKNLNKQCVKEMQKFGKDYPFAGYGTFFKGWLKEKNPQPYNSYGNGAAMRISSVAYFAKSLDEVKLLSDKVTSVSHNHPEGIKGAESAAVAIWLALNKKSKAEIKDYIEKHYYKLDFDYDDLKENYTFNETSQDTVPQAIYCFLISNDFEDCLRTSVSIGGDTDTLCAISCAIAEAFYGIPERIHNQATAFLDKNLLKIYAKYFRQSTRICEKLH